MKKKLLFVLYTFIVYACSGILFSLWENQISGKYIVIILAILGAVAGFGSAYFCSD